MLWLGNDHCGISWDITSMLLNMTRLVVLDLSYNKIGALQKMMFEQMFSLHQLIISHNKIDYLTEELFRDMKNMRYLDLSHNLIDKVTWNILLGLVYLYEFNLFNNTLEELDYSGRYLRSEIVHAGESHLCCMIVDVTSCYDTNALSDISGCLGIFGTLKLKMFTFVIGLATLLVNMTATFVVLVVLNSNQFQHKKGMRDKTDLVLAVHLSVFDGLYLLVLICPMEPTSI